MSAGWPFEVDVTDREGVAGGRRPGSSSRPSGRIDLLVRERGHVPGSGLGGIGGVDVDTLVPTSSR